MDANRGTIITYQIRAKLSYCNSSIRRLETVTMASPRSESIVQAFISRHRTLLAQERVAEIERTSLTLSNASPKLLEQRGLALGGLSIVSAGVGLGGKTYVIVSYHRSLQHLMYTVKRRLVELERPSAFHPSPVFPPHTFRVVSAGTIASLMEPE